MSPQGDSAQRQPSNLPKVIWIAVGLLVVWNLYKGLTVQEIGIPGLTIKFGRVVLPSSPSAPPSQTTSCEIAGDVYNSDDNKPLAGVRVFVRKGPRAGDWVPLASSGPDGHFQGSCVGFAQTAFPLHLGVTDDRWRCTPADPPFSADGWEVIQQSGAPNVNLFVSVKGMIRLKIIACRPN